MTYFIQPIITDKAQSEVAHAIANKQPITFTRMVLGSGRHVSELVDKTNVVNAVHTLQVTQSLSESDNIKIVGRLDNSNISQEVIVNEIGIFARVGNRAEFMYMYTSAQNGDVIPPRTEAELIRDYEFNTRISKSGTLSVIYDNSEKVYAKQSDFVRMSEMIRNLNLTYVTQAAVNIFTQGYEKFKSIVEQHIEKRDNPHGVTKSQVGLGSVENIRQASFSDFNAHEKDNIRHITSNDRQTWNNKANAVHKHSIDEVSGLQSQLTSATEHIASCNNPHNVTKLQIGLSNVDNVQQASKSEFDLHTSDNIHHITPQERIKWNGKAEASHTHLSSEVEGLQVHMSTANAHITKRDNPHNVTKTQIGLSNVINVEQASLSEFNNLKQLIDHFGVNNGQTPTKYVCPQGTDFASYLKSSAVPIGFSLVRDGNTSISCRVLKEDSQWIFVDAVHDNKYKMFQIRGGHTDGWTTATPIDGVNTNGSWVRLSNGVQICYGTPSMAYGSGVYTDKKTLHYAAGFISQPTVSLTVNVTPQSATHKRLPGVNLTDISTTSVSFTVGDNAGGRSNSQLTVHYIAIGRWK